MNATPNDPHIDHKDGNGLNNLKANLRFASAQQNQANERIKPHSSRFKGVCWNKTIKKWKAYIKVQQLSHNLGHFAREEDAARAYNKAAAEHFGEFARLNVIL